MSMLAERRRKEHYNLVPRLKELYHDESRFGTQMLKKMGWSAGKGLGAKESGSVDFVRVKYKNCLTGLGFEQRDDQWTQHEQNFSGLLQALNGEAETDATTTTATKADKMDSNSDNNSDDDAPRAGFGFSETKPPKVVKLKEKFSGESLEEKSKQSRARVHYKKFTRGKDLSRYSEKDLANIFGKKAIEDVEHQAVTIVEEDDNEAEAETQHEDKETEEPESKHFIQKTMSVNDYFKQKMEAMKNRKLQAIKNDNSPPALEAESKDEEQQSDNSSSRKRKNNKAIEIADEEVQEPLKKKKKSKRQDVETNSPTEETPAELLHNGNVEKSKKRKRKTICEETEELVVESTQIIDEELTTKKKKKKSKSKSKENSSEKEEEEKATETEEVQPIVVKEKKSKRKEKTEIIADAAAEPEIQTEEAVVVVVEKKKKKKTKKAEEFHNVEELEIKERSETKKWSQNNTTKDKSPESNKNEKKPKKIKSKESQATNDVPAAIEVITKMKKNKKTKKCDKNNSAENEANTNTDTDTDTNTNTNVINVSDTQITKEANTTAAAIAEDLNTIYKSFNIYKISSYCAEKFSFIDLERFHGSNIKDIIGYGYDENITVDIETIPSDERRINDLWNSRMSKYLNEAPKSQYGTYCKNVRNALNSKVKIPKFNVKHWKRKTAFTGLI